MSQSSKQRLSELVHPEGQLSSTEGRIHQRYGLIHPHISIVQFSTHCYGSIQDLSYGGLSAIVNERETLLALNNNSCEPIDIKLTLLGHSLPCIAKLMSHSADRVGLQFVHQRSDLLIFLRRFLEPMRMGKSLSEIKTVDTATSHEFTDPYGNTLAITMNTSNCIELALLTFSLDGYFHEVVCKNSDISVSTAVTDFANGAIYDHTEQSCRAVLESAAFILLGLCANHTNEAALALLSFIIKKLDANSFYQITYASA